MRLFAALRIWRRLRTGIAFCVVCLAGLLTSAEAAHAADSKLEELIVTGVRAERLAKIPKSVTVITADDIARASSNSIVTLLAREANLNLRSVTGNDKFSGIDIRGMGDTFSSNVIVLVDGVRLNAPDLSGADFSSISLAQIERIEVIRGGGGVRYGNGAVGGVINIITKKVPETDSAAFGASYGSFNTLEGRLNLAVTRFGVSLKIDAAKSDSDGHRHNGDLSKDDFTAKLNYSPIDWVNFELGASYHKDRYGLPGSISREAFLLSSLSRRQTNMPRDSGETTDQRYRGKITFDLGQFGTLTGLGDYRTRDNPYVIGFSPLLSVREQQSKIAESSSTLEVGHEISKTFGWLEVQLNSGYSNYRSKYSQRRSGTTLVGQSERHPGSIDNKSGFLDLGINVKDKLAINLGYRKDVFDLRRRDESLREFCDFETVTIQVPQVIPFFGTIFRSVDSVVQTNCRNEFEVTNNVSPSWKNNAYELGIVLTPIESLNIFVSHSRSFRNPNVDELILASTDLGPQQGKHWDFGFRFRPSSFFETSLSVFKIDIENEIFFGFDPVLSQNRNTNLAGVTNRRGGEFEIRVSPVARLSVWGSYGFIKATNSDTGASVPLVPEDTYSLGARLEAVDNLNIEMLARYIGPRFDGNDFDNKSFRELDAHTVVDAKIHYRHKAHQISFGINNVLNEIYATSVYSGTYFPMPERNFYAAINLTF